jgi:hypothetical protein
MKEAEVRPQSNAEAKHVNFQLKIQENLGNTQKTFIVKTPKYVSTEQAGRNSELDRHKPECKLYPKRTYKLELMLQE